MKIIKKAVHTEKYTDKATGEEKKKYTQVGALFQRDDGSMCMKFLDSWINFYDLDNHRTQQSQGQSYAQKDNAPVRDDFEDDIPF